MKTGWKKAFKTSFDVELITKLCEEGLSFKEISERVNISLVQLRRLRIRFNIKIPKKLYDIPLILQLYKEGKSKKDLCIKFNISPRYLNNVLYKKLSSRCIFEIEKDVPIETLPGEIWKQIEYKNCSSYLISNLGRLYSLPKKVSSKNGNIKILPGKIVKCGDSKGYRYISLLNEKGDYVNALIHRLVAFSFIPNPENKPYINHIDCNKSNNHVDNLEWCTARENSLHAVKSGLFPRLPKISDTNCRKLTMKDINDIYELVKFKNKTNKEICDIYNIHNKGAVGVLLKYMHPDY